MNVLRKVSREAAGKRWRVMTPTTNNRSSITSTLSPAITGVSRHFATTAGIAKPDAAFPSLTTPFPRQRNAHYHDLLQRPFSTATEANTPTEAATEAAAAATEATTTNDHDIQESKQRVLASALQGDAVQAQKELDQLRRSLLLEATTTSSSSSSSQESILDESLLEYYDAVLDAWVAHQEKLVQEFNTNNNDNINADGTTINRSNKKKLQHQIFEAADMAHQALEHTVPFLSRPMAMALNNNNNARMSTKGRRAVAAAADEVDLEDDLPLAGVTTKRKQQHYQSPEVMLHKCNRVLTAWARASKASPAKQGIPQRATFLLQRMEASGRYTSGGSSSGSGSSGSVQPTTESYNRVLEAWAWSHEHLRATMAEQLFQTMMKQKSNTNNSSNSNSNKKLAAAKPNGESYRWIIQAWCHSRQRKSAFTATGHLMQYLRRLEKGQSDLMEPTLETYHMAMEAWTTAEDKNAPIKAMGILRIMEYAESKKYCSVPVDETCYRHFLTANAKRAVIPEQGPLADQILTKLKDRQIVPDGASYGAAIRTWKNAAHNPLYGASREHSVSRAVDLLEELSVAHQRSSTKMIRPTTEHFNDVLEALSASYKAVSRDIATALADVMENSIVEESENALSDIRPNAKTYKWLLLVHVKSKKRDKIEDAKLVLERVKVNLSTVAEDSEKLEDDLVGVYNAFVQVCASYNTDGNNQGDERTSDSEVLQSALQAVEELRSIYGLRPNSETYGNLLEVCTQLEAGLERSRVTESIFQTCCEEGLVDESVLKALKGTVSDDQYFELVISQSDAVEGSSMVPEEWTSSVGVNRVITADGRKAMPLRVDGRYTITKAMKEFKMRKLRSKANQRTLQGGRLKLDKKLIGKPIRIYLKEEEEATA